MICEMDSRRRKKWILMDVLSDSFEIYVVHNGPHHTYATRVISTKCSGLVTIPVQYNNGTNGDHEVHLLKCCRYIWEIHRRYDLLISKWYGQLAGLYQFQFVNNSS